MAFTVLDITKFFAPTSGGIRTYLLARSAYVRTRPGLRQVVVVPDARPSRTDDGPVTWYRLAGPRIPTQAPYRFLLDRAGVVEIIRRERPDVIELGSPYLVPWLVRGVARRLGIPIVWFFHTDFPRIIAPPGGGAGRIRRAAARAARWYVGRVGRAADLVLAASRLAREDLEAAGVRHVRQVPLGVDTEVFTPARRDRAARTREEFGLPPAGPLAVFAGRLAREKNLELVLEAWPAVEARSGAHLVLAGEGPSRRYYERRTAARRVHWVPYVTDRGRLADLLAAADLYLAPGPAETFGLSALEAMASGTPVISVEGAVAELVRASGAGAVVGARDPAGLAEQCLALLDAGAAPRTRVREYAAGQHAWPVVFDRLFDTYHDLAASWHPSP